MNDITYFVLRFSFLFVILLVSHLCPHSNEFPASRHLSVLFPPYLPCLEQYLTHSKGSTVLSECMHGLMLKPLSWNLHLGWAQGNCFNQQTLRPVVCKKLGKYFKGIKHVSLPPKLPRFLEETEA